MPAPKARTTNRPDALIEYTCMGCSATATENRRTRDSSGVDGWVLCRSAKPGKPRQTRFSAALCPTCAADKGITVGEEHPDYPPEQDRPSARTRKGPARNPIP